MAKLLALLLAFMCVLYGQSGARVDARPADDLQEETNESEEQKKELMNVLHIVLEGLQKKRLSILQRKYRRLPGVCKRLRRRVITILCNVGDFCSVKRGARHGQLCDCPRGSKCNYFFVKCL